MYGSQDFVISLQLHQYPATFSLGTMHPYPALKTMIHFTKRTGFLCSWFYWQQIYAVSKKLQGTLHWMGMRFLKSFKAHYIGWESSLTYTTRLLLTVNPKDWRDKISSKKVDQVKFFKGCLPQILLGLLLNTLCLMKHWVDNRATKFWICESWLVANNAG